MRYLDVPAAWLGNVIFPARPFPGPYEVRVGDDLWRFGIAPPLAYSEKFKEPRLASLCIDHARLIFLLLEHTRQPGVVGNLSFRGLCRQLYGSHGTKQTQRLTTLIEDLQRTYISISTTNGSHETMPILREPTYKTFEKRPHSLVLKELHLSQPFLQHLGRITNLLKLRLDVLLSLKHRISAAAYLYLPSRAIGRYKAGHGNFEINLATFLRQVGEMTPATKSKRLRMIQRGKVDIIRDLHGAAISSGSLTCTLEETVDKRDYKLVFGYEPDERNQEGVGSLFARWRSQYPFLPEAEARSRYQAACSRMNTELNDYDLNILSQLGVNVTEVSRLLLVAEQLMRPGDLSLILGSVRDRADTLENATASVIAAVLDSVGPSESGDHGYATRVSIIKPPMVSKEPKPSQPPLFPMDDLDTHGFQLNKDVAKQLQSTPLLDMFRSQGGFYARLQGSSLDHSFLIWLQNQPTTVVQEQYRNLNSEGVE